MACIIGAVVAIAGGIYSSERNRQAQAQQMYASSSAQQTQQLTAACMGMQQSMAAQSAGDAAVLQAYGFAGAQGTAATGQAVSGIAGGAQRPMGYA